MKQLSLGEYLEWFDENNFKYEIVPGISSWSAMNALTGIDITQNLDSNNIYITSLGWQKKPNSYDLKKFETIVSTQPCVVLYQSYEMWHKIQPILEMHYAPSARVLFVYKISWGDQKIIDTTLGDAYRFINDESLSKHTIILIKP